MYSDTGNTTSLVLGFPIRTSSDPRSVGSSPRHIAASHVLHRPLMPRHPPCALKHLQQKHKNQKQFSEKITPQQTHTHRREKTNPHKGESTQHARHECRLDARNHYPRIKHHTPPPSRATTHLSPRRARTTGLLSQDPTVCLMISFSPPSPTTKAAGLPRVAAFVACAPDPHPLQARGHLTNRPAHRTPTSCGRVWVSWCSLERR
jgi:hypothetical protein